MAGAPNSEQRDYWNGDDSREWVEHPTRFDQMLAPIGALVLERAGLAGGMRVLDVGCGNGAMAIDAAEQVAPDGTVVGIDLSDGMLEVARGRAADLAVDNVAFVAADAQVADLGGPHDAIVSRFGIMFFDDPDAAFSNLARSLAPNGRITFACWAPMLENEWVATPVAAMIEAIGPPSELPPPDQPGPFRYAEPDALIASLEGAGLREIAVDRVDVPILLGGRGSLDDACSFIAASGMTRALLGDAAPEDRERALVAIRASLEPLVTDDGVRVGSSTWIVTAHSGGR
jgi:SAM-dependent methyltransferase